MKKFSALLLLLALFSTLTGCAEYRLISYSAVSKVLDFRCLSSTYGNYQNNPLICERYVKECATSADGDQQKAISCLDAAMESERLKDQQQLKEAEDKKLAQQQEQQQKEVQVRQAQQILINQQIEQQRIAAVARQDAMNIQVKQDEARGYRYISIEDYQLDASSMPLGKKVDC